MCQHCCSACLVLLLQENYFFDGPNKELNTRLVVLRLRFYDTDKKAVLTLKVWRLRAIVCGVLHTAAPPPVTMCTASRCQLWQPHSVEAAAPTVARD